jgi:hypothetical protein
VCSRTTLQRLTCITQATSADGDNLFFHRHEDVGDLWTLAYAKEAIYNIGANAMEPVSGRFFQLKAWPFAWCVLPCILGHSKLNVTI